MLKLGFLTYEDVGLIPCALSVTNEDQPNALRRHNSLLYLVEELREAEEDLWDGIPSASSWNELATSG